DNTATLEAGQLLLIDAGARYRMYCGDVSRTFPVSGAFSPEQRDVYDVVLAAHDAAIAQVRPGSTIEQVHEAARRTALAAHADPLVARPGRTSEHVPEAALRAALAALVALGVSRGTGDELLEKKEEYRAVLPHRTSHWLGLDVHDVGDYETAGQHRRLVPGM